MKSSSAIVPGPPVPLMMPPLATITAILDSSSLSISKADLLFFIILEYLLISIVFIELSSSSPDNENK